MPAVLQPEHQTGVWTMITSPPCELVQPLPSKLMQAKVHLDHRSKVERAFQA
jgi:hypothetical protein